MKLVVIGGGGHAKVVTDSARAAGWEMVGFADDRPDARLFDLQYLGSPQSLQVPQDARVVVAIGSNKLRQQMVERFSGRVNWATVIHPRAIVSSFATIQAGTVIFAGAVIQADTVVEQHCIVNTSASIDHDCKIADFCHVAPNAVLAGNVNLKTGAFVGAGSVVLPGRCIGEWATLGAGGVSVRDLDSGGTYVGVPAEPRIPS